MEYSSASDRLHFRGFGGSVQNSLPDGCPYHDTYLYISSFSKRIPIMANTLKVYDILVMYDFYVMGSQGHVIDIGNDLKVPH